MASLLVVVVVFSCSGTYVHSSLKELLCTNKTLVSCLLLCSSAFELCFMHSSLWAALYEEKE